MLEDLLETALNLEWFWNVTMGADLSKLNFRGCAVQEAAAFAWVFAVTAYFVHTTQQQNKHNRTLSVVHCLGRTNNSNANIDNNNNSDNENNNDSSKRQ